MIKQLWECYAMGARQYRSSCVYTVCGDAEMTRWLRCEKQPGGQNIIFQTYSWDVYIWMLYLDNSHRDQKLSFNAMFTAWCLYVWSIDEPLNCVICVLCFILFYVMSLLLSLCFLDDFIPLTFDLNYICIMQPQVLAVTSDLIEQKGCALDEPSKSWQPTVRQLQQTEPWSPPTHKFDFERTFSGCGLWLTRWKNN